MGSLAAERRKSLATAASRLLLKWWSREFSPPLRGVAARSRKSREASLTRADGDERSECKRDSAQLVISGVQLQQNSVEFDHHPVRSIKEASRYFVDVASTPPRRGGENCGPLRFGNSPERPWRNSRRAVSRGSGERFFRRSAAHCLFVTKTTAFGLG